VSPTFNKVLQEQEPALRRRVTAVANGLQASAADTENQTGPSHHQPVD
jgi:hypothetical protein